MPKHLNVRNLESILRQTGLYDKIPINANKRDADFTSVADEILKQDKDK